MTLAVPFQFRREDGLLGRLADDLLRRKQLRDKQAKREKQAPGYET